MIVIFDKTPTTFAMTATKTLPKIPKKIPAQLIYEEFGGRVYYRKGYRAVLTKKKTIEEIIGSSSLQAFLVSIIHGELLKCVSVEFLVFTNEVGLHVELNKNLSNDIAIFELAKITKLDDHYFDIAPQTVVEVDIKIEIENNTDMDYMLEKSQLMHDFGVEKVFWILTKTRRVIVSEKDKNGIIADWNTVIDWHANCSFSIMNLLKQKGLAHLLA